ncbi:MAG: Tex family protein, partial [Candidatus Hodarchaeota archaeon]
MDFVSTISKKNRLTPQQVQEAIHLLDEGNTIPFIARYRKERTGNLDEESLRQIELQYERFKKLVDHQEKIIKLIEKQGKLTPDLKEKILFTTTISEVDDLYLPFRPKRRTRALIAREMGLEPLATLIIEQKTLKGNPEDFTNQFLSEKVTGTDDALKGASDIVAELIAEDAELRKLLRQRIFQNARIITKNTEKEVEDAERYQKYFKHEEAMKTIPHHRILAINRGEKRGVLSVKLEVDKDEIIALALEYIISNPKSLFTSYLQDAVKDSYTRLIQPAIFREVRKELTLKASDHAVKVFAENVRKILLQPPTRNMRIMGIDPGYRTGCKVATIDEHGRFINSTTIYPNKPHEKDEINAIKEILDNDKIKVIALGNGTASRETERFLQAVCRGTDIKYTIISEAGASVYSASEIAKEEFPDLDITIRGAISIARRLQDPLPELIKINVHSIGVGQYQHDCNPKDLDKALTGVVESVVSDIGVDVNNASSVLLQHVAGITPSIARNIVDYRSTNGLFKTRKELLKVKRLGSKAYEQAAGFCKVYGKEPLDRTRVHPESYAIAKKILHKIGYTPSDLIKKETKEGIKVKLQKLNVINLAREYEVGQETVKDIIDFLLKPDRDPRDDIHKPIFKQDILTFNDLEEGKILQGVVRNVVDFGAFVDIGLKESGLVHISELSATQFIKNPHEVIAVGDVVKVKIISIDKARGRVGLSIKQVERKEQYYKSKQLNKHYTTKQHQMQDQFKQAGFTVRRKRRK